MTIKHCDFKIRDPKQLTMDLIEAQYTLKDSRDKKNAKSLIILVSGIELAGKGEAVKQLREWMDPRYLGVKADPPQPFCANQSFWQPYVRHIPSEGQIQILFGNWYSDLLSSATQVGQPMDEGVFQNYVQRMRDFEQDLKNNHCDVIKVWFDLSWKSLQKRLDQLEPSQQKWQKLHGLDWRSKKQYDALQQLRQYFTSDWLVIECDEPDHRDQRFAQHVLAALQQLPVHQTAVREAWQQTLVPEALMAPSTQQMEKDEYKHKLKKLSSKVAKAITLDSRNIIIAFEGMDAAGKGGAIKRIVKGLDPRQYQIHSIGAPEKYELRRPYLWRFWNKLNTEGELSIFDRTWYGRVLVERVEGYASAQAWQRAYDEINRFEYDLSHNQTLLIKFWLAIDLDEQDARFKSREKTPHKRFKITDEDWRNRGRWDDYLHAAADMLSHTHTAYAPWHVIASNDKYTARIAILEAILERIEARQVEAHPLEMNQLEMHQ